MLPDSGPHDDRHGHPAPVAVLAATPTPVRRPGATATSTSRSNQRTDQGATHQVPTPRRQEERSRPDLQRSSGPRGRRGVRAAARVPLLARRSRQTPAEGEVDGDTAWCRRDDGACRAVIRAGVQRSATTGGDVAGGVDYGQYRRHVGLVPPRPGVRGRAARSALPVRAPRRLPTRHERRQTLQRAIVPS